MPTTTENLHTAFAGESQANRKYLAFARKAEKEGFPMVAKLFMAACEAETIHALGHLNALGGVGETAANLRSAIEGETYEYTEMYPPMLAQALAENHKAKIMFNFANQAEAVHAKLFKLALEAVESGKDLTGVDFYVCPVCGDIELGVPTERCPICGAPAARYQKI